MTRIILITLALVCLPTMALAGSHHHYRHHHYHYRHRYYRHHSHYSLHYRHHSHYVARRSQQTSRRSVGLFGQVFKAPDAVVSTTGRFLVRGGSRLLARASRDVGRNPTGWSHVWCGRQMNMWLSETGHQTSGSNTAISFAHYGVRTRPRPGAIAVFPHHVGIVASVGPGYVVLLSGNHGGHSGHRTVGYGRYSISSAVSFRWPV